MDDLIKNVTFNVKFGRAISGVRNLKLNTNDLTIDNVAFQDEAGICTAEITDKNNTTNNSALIQWSRLNDTINFVVRGLFDLTDDNQLVVGGEYREIYLTLNNDGIILAMKFPSGTGGASTTKFKTGDVVYYSNYNGKDHFGVMPFEDYESNPTSDKNTRFPIGLVADPVKRTFVFTDLINACMFVNGSCISDYLAGYTSLDNGQETAKRLSTIGGSVLNSYFPAFYDLRYNPKSNGSCFYTKQEDAYIPSLKEWEDVYSLCIGMYDASQMDKLICLKNGVTPAMGTYIIPSHQFYGQTSSVGNSQTLFPFNLVGDTTSLFNPIFRSCPAFGIYTEEEENNYPEF